MKNKEKEEKIEKMTKSLEVPKDINITINNKEVVFEKNKEEIKVYLNLVFLKLEKDGTTLKIIPRDTKKKNLAIVNTTYKLIANAINGFNKDYVCKLAVVYSHFPMTLKVEHNQVVISNFLGEKKPRKVRIMDGCKVSINGKEILVSGKNKYMVGQTAGNIERITRVTKKDYRVFDDGCYIVEKTK